MKLFNLEEALTGKPVVTRHGKKVKEIITFKDNSVNEHQPLCVLIDDTVYFYKKEGYYVLPNVEHDFDLFMYEEPAPLDLFNYNPNEQHAYKYFTDAQLTAIQRALMNDIERGSVHSSIRGMVELMIRNIIAEHKIRINNELELAKQEDNL